MCPISSCDQCVWRWSCPNITIPRYKQLDYIFSYDELKHFMDKWFPCTAIAFSLTNNSSNNKPLYWVRALGRVSKTTSLFFPSSLFSYYDVMKAKRALHDIVALIKTCLRLHAKYSVTMRRAIAWNNQDINYAVARVLSQTHERHCL